jgi:ATP-dependent DNA helicase RecQ
MCYQLPSLITQRTVVVVSPLISLMEDQVVALTNKGISACFLGSAQLDAAVPRKAATGEYRLVYLSPEKVQEWRQGLTELVDGPGVTCFAIDEAHCISQWGHDFRESYTQLRVLRQWFPAIPILALTATATDRVCDDIIGSLMLRNAVIVKGSNNRANLSYAVRMKTSLVQDLTVETIGTESCIVYCNSHKMAEEAGQVRGCDMVMI